jgi:4-diphosphocytidyl-2-C-methyl-D-erythritol kinase
VLYTVLTVLAPAKINLALEVGAPRKDGYHEVATVLQTIALYDKITVREADTDIELIVSGPQAEGGRLDGGQANLVWRAARLFAQAMGKSKAGVSIGLEKHIPVAAGLGGGSSDAAATLLALARLWDVDNHELVYALATQLGSDVAFFLKGGAALGSGRGEIITPLRLPMFWLCLANPDVPTSTAQVYRELAAMRAAGNIPLPDPLGERCGRLIYVLHTAGVAAASRYLDNDLAEAAKRVSPAITRLIEAFREAGALGVQVSGSGSTVYALAADATEAEALADTMRTHAGWVWWGCCDLGGKQSNERSVRAN